MPGANSQASSYVPAVQVSLEYESYEFATGLIEGLKRPRPIEQPTTEAEMVSIVHSLVGASDETVRHELGKIVGWLLRDPFQAYRGEGK